MQESPEEMVRRRFNSPLEVAKYRRRATQGLLIWEEAVVQEYLAPPAKLLDIGCGGGREALALRDRGYQVTGIDISPRELEAAHKIAAARGSGIEFHVCDGRTLDFPDEWFDYVIMWGQVLGNVPGQANRMDVLRECSRVLMPTGRLSFSAHNRDVCEPVARRKGWALEVPDIPLEEGDLILRGDSVSDTPCFWHYFHHEEIVALCDSAGFVPIVCCPAKDLGQKDWSAIWVCVCEKLRLL